MPLDHFPTFSSILVTCSKPKFKIEVVSVSENSNIFILEAYEFKHTHAHTHFNRQKAPLFASIILAEIGSVTKTLLVVEKSEICHCLQLIKYEFANISWTHITCSHTEEQKRF